MIPEAIAALPEVPVKLSVQPLAPLVVICELNHATRELSLWSIKHDKEKILNDCEYVEVSYN